MVFCHNCQKLDATRLCSYYNKTMSKNAVKRVDVPCDGYKKKKGVLK